MKDTIDLTLDVRDSAGFGRPAWIAVTVSLPDPATVASAPVVCFAKPGAGFSRRYYTCDLPGPASGAQADWHTDRGWIFVSIDHLGVGDSSTDLDSSQLDLTVLARASLDAENQVLSRLRGGTLSGSFPPLVEPVRIGIGQSMGGAVTIVQQGRYHCYDGVAILGYSAVHTHPPSPHGEPLVAAWRLRDLPDLVLNQRRVDASDRTLGSPVGTASIHWSLYWDETESGGPISTGDSQAGRGAFPPWLSATLPHGLLGAVLTPGVVAPEAAAIESPVLVAMGQRDSVPDPRGELRAYMSSPSVDFFVCPRMAHMHNFAGTRELFWQKIDTWGSWVRCAKIGGGLLV